MQSKSLLIAVAAFAVTATGVHAYGGTKILARAGLSDDQVEAFEEARELRSSGDFTGARDKLVEAGVTDDVLRSIHEASRTARNEMREALMNDDYESFKKAVADSPLADIITSEADFEQFREAHEHRLAGEWEEAEEIFDSLGLEDGHGMGMRHGGKGFFSEMSSEQKEAFMVAKQANDRATMQAIYDEAGEGHKHSHFHNHFHRF